MTIDQIIKTVELTFTALGLPLVIFGWIIPYRQNLRIEARRKTAEKPFRQKQWEKS